MIAKAFAEARSRSFREVQLKITHEGSTIVGMYRCLDVVTEPMFAVRGTCETSTGAMVCVETTVTCTLRFGGLPIKQVESVLRRSVIERVERAVRKLHPTEMTMDLEAAYLPNKTTAEADGVIFRCPISDRAERVRMEETIRDLRYLKRGAERASDLVLGKATIQSKIKAAEDHLASCFSCRTRYHERVARTQNKKITEFRDSLVMTIYRKAELIGAATWSNPPSNR